MTSPAPADDALVVVGTADTHIASNVALGGMSPTIDGRPLVLVQGDRSLAWIREMAATRFADLGVHAGDVYEHPAPGPAAEAVMITRAIELAEVCPWVVLLGNHDAPKGGGVHALEPMRNLAPGRWYIADTPDPILLIDDGIGRRLVPAPAGPAQLRKSHRALAVVFPLPYPQRAGAERDASSGDAANLAVSEGMTAILRAHALAASPWRAVGVPAGLAVHFTLRGAAFSAHQVAPANDVAIPVAEFWPAFDFHVVGHIHLRQPAPGTGGLPGYVGPPDRHDFGEEAYTPGLSVFDVRAGATTERHIVNPTARRFRTIPLEEGAPILAALVGAGADAARLYRPDPVEGVVAVPMMPAADGGQVEPPAVTDETVYRVVGTLNAEAFAHVSAIVRSWRSRRYIIANACTAAREDRIAVVADPAAIRNPDALLEAVFVARPALAARADDIRSRLCQLIPGVQPPASTTTHEGATPCASTN